MKVSFPIVDGRIYCEKMILKVFLHNILYVNCSRGCRGFVRFEYGTHSTSAYGM